MKLELVGEKLVLHRTAEEKAPFAQRLARVEGQVRGLRQMIEDNRYCGEAVQQGNAIIAAVREVALMLIAQQLQTQALEMGRPDSVVAEIGAKGLSDFVEMLRSTYRLQ